MVDLGWTPLEQAVCRMNDARSRVEVRRTDHARAVKAELDEREWLATSERLYQEAKDYLLAVVEQEKIVTAT